MEKTTSKTLAVLLLILCFIATVCAEDTMECTSGAGCFPNGLIPDRVTSKDAAYYCCPLRNFTRHGNRLPNGTQNCTCVHDLTLESKTVKYAQSTQGDGRMCSLGKDCEGVKSSTTINHRFKYCCYKDNRTQKVTNTTITTFDGDKTEFILCRCLHLPVPTPDPKAYVVPPVQTYNSTGEVCSYDAGCREKPFAKCQTEWPYKVTFCCYGSRGIVTENDGNFTRCTCTDEVYKGQCEATPRTIAESTAEDTMECTSGAGCFPNGLIPDGLTSKDAAYYCCPLRNFTRHGNRLPNGTQNCTCVHDLTLESKTVKYAQSTQGDGRMCSLGKDCEGVKSSTTINHRFKYCCYMGNRTQINENRTITTFDGDKTEFILCRCLHLPVPTPDPKAYVVPPVQTYNSTGEVCSYDAGCREKPFAKCQTEWPYKVTFCCYGSRGIVTENDGNFTRCTCTDEVYKGQCEATPRTIAESTAEDTMECTSGAGCFPNGLIPDGLTSKDAAYYCCPLRNFTRHGNRLPNGTQNCTCVHDLTLESKTVKYAQSTQGDGRMCSLGKDCEGVKSSTTINHRFKYCCYMGNRTQINENRTITTFDGDKTEFILCRCLHLPVPTPDPKAYVVPPVQTYNSTGEVCSYDAGCREKPFAKCQTEWPYKVTFCCYGSRGIVTENDGNFTRCTCTDEVYKGQCEATPRTIAESTAEDTMECTSGAGCFPNGLIPDEVTSEDDSYYCCLQRNFTRHGNRLPNSTQNCTCVHDLTLESKTVKYAQSTQSEGRMCSLGKDCEGAKSSTTINHRFKYCCYKGNRTQINENTTVTTFDGDKTEFILCRCLHLPVPTPDPKAYVVPPVQTYNSTGEVCSYDAGCREKPFAKCQTEWPYKVTFCCYGSRGIVTENDGNFTRCTCTDEVYKGQCEATPRTIAESTAECLSECSNRAAEDTCTDRSQAVRCCPHNMAVVATQSEGNFTSCTCKAQAKKSCGLKCDTGCSKRTAVDTCTDSSQATRCCPPGLVVVATQSGGNFASCMCEEKTQKSCGDGCLTECSARLDSDTCTDDSRSLRCCPGGLAVVATQSGGNFTSCLCKARVKKSCGKESSFATRARGSLTDIISLVFAAFLLGGI